MVTLQAIRPESHSLAAVRAAEEDASEFYHYEDNGCEVSSSCLDCPLPVCRYDAPGWYIRNRRLARDFRIVQVIERECLTVKEAANRFSLTPRTIFRIMQRCREAGLVNSDSGAMLMAA